MTYANAKQAIRVTTLGLAVLAITLWGDDAKKTARGVGHPRLADSLLVKAAEPVEGSEPEEGRFQPAALDPAIAFAVETAEDGTRFLMIRYRSEGAGGIRLKLQRFSLPEDARVFLYDSQGRGEAVVFGPFTKLGPNGDGEFWTPAISGPEAVLELQFGSLDIADLPFAVSEIEVLGGDRLRALQIAEQESRFERERQQAAREENAPQRRRSIFRGVILEHSVEENKAMFEGDIVLGTADELVDAGEAKPSTVDKAGLVISGANYRWPGGVVPYVVDPDMPDVARITNAIAHWNQQLAGNLRLVLRTTENDYINIQRVAAGCSAYVGRIGGAQGVFISDACSTGNVIHEIGHAVGLWHEQGREDRDSKVKINWANISSSASFNFTQNISDGDDAGAYDYGSIMHYGAYAFSINGLPTIETIPPGIPIGQRNALSAGDVAAVKSIYPASGTGGATGSTTTPPTTPPAPPPVVSRTVTLNSNPQGLRLVLDGTEVVTPFSTTFADDTAHTLAASSPQTLSGVSYNFTGWTDGATQSSRSFTVKGSNVFFTATFAAVVKRTLTLSTTPAGMQLSVNGAPVVTPYSNTFNDGTQVTLTAAASQAFEGTPYNFAGWSDGGTQTSRTVTLSNNITLIASYAEAVPVAPTTRAVTFASSPGGLRLFVNGWTTVTPFVYNFAEGTNHTVSAPPQQMAAGILYNFSAWTDGNTQPTRAFTVGRADLVFSAVYVAATAPVTSGPTLRTVNFDTAPSGLRLTVDGQVVTTPFTATWADGTTHTVTAADQNSGPVSYSFSGWSDGTQNGTRTIVVSGSALFYQATFALHAGNTPVLLTTNPFGRTLTLDGQPVNTPYATIWAAGTTRTLAASDQATATGSRFKFSSWSDGSTSPSRTLTAGSSPIALGANFMMEHLVTAAPGVTFDPPSPSGYYPEQAIVTLSTQVPAGMCFLGWTGLTATSPVTRLTVTRPISVTPQFAVGAAKVTPVTVPTVWSGGPVTFNANGGGCPVTASSNVWWARVFQVSPTQVVFWIDQNRDPWTRTALLTIAGVTYTYTQSGFGVQ